MARPVNNVQKDERTNEILILEAIETLKGIPEATASVYFLRLLYDHKNAEWLKIKEPESYPYASKLYENRRWLAPDGKRLPPGTTYLGIVLEKTLEVSVVESLDDGRKYHRPMAILPRGCLFGAFEAVDLFCKTQPLQDYTVFSGIRTFFFEDPLLDTFTSPTPTFINPLRGQLSGDNQTNFNNWNQKETYSPTQTPLFLLKAVVGSQIIDWCCKVLFIEIGSSFSNNAPSEIRELVYRVAWRQSANLRHHAIQAFSTDSISQLLGKKRTGVEAIPAQHRFAIARELSAIPGILMEERPGFHKYETADSGCIGPFETFFKKLKLFESVKQPGSKAIYAASYLFGAKTPLVFPLWPNFDPLCDKAGEVGPNDGPGIVNTVAKLKDEIITELLPGDHSYRKGLIRFVGPPKKAATGSDTETTKRPVTPGCLRGYIEIKPSAPILPLFQSVPEWTNGPVAGLICLQHLMEETLCLMEELVCRNIVEAKNIWLLGKPYSSNQRVAQRLRLFGANVEVPTEGWSPGCFDEWFENQAKTFLNKALTELKKNASQNPAPIVLLDDGGALIAAATTQKWNGGFCGVEQTSRGISFALEAVSRFPVVLIACSALKSIVEPEFVARAAISKIAHYYPEALRMRNAGVVGLGTLGEYFSKYLIARRDIHDEVDVYGFDQSGSSFQHKSFQACASADAVFQQADVVYGCTGRDLGGTALKHSDQHRLLISLSSSDVEFASILKRANGAKDERRILSSVLMNKTTIANRGFPITFDGSVSSAPLIEMQLTRALLLAGIQQAILAYENGKTGPIPLSGDDQWQIWMGWNQHALDGDGKGCPLLTSWRKSREQELTGTELGSELLNVAARIGTKSEWEGKNKAFFEKAISSAQKLRANASGRKSGKK